MEHKSISRLLILAGAIATIGILFVFYVSTPLRTAFSGAPVPFPWLTVLAKAILGLPYLLALHQYFFICHSIGNNRSFCRENVTGMNRISLLLVISAVLWLVTLSFELAGGPEVHIIGQFSDALSLPYFSMICIAALAMMASLAVALVAKMMAHLVNRAVCLQEDSDLTI